MARNDLGSLTKEPPLATLDATITAITPGMAYDALLAYARAHTHRDAPGLLRQRFLLVRKDGSITYDHFLSLVATYGLKSLLVRKAMYFLWAYRDHRIRDFICTRIADKTGRWRANQLVNKRNATFFEQWLAASTAKKARSNFEFFLVETGIYDSKSNKIHLDLDDGWLQHAAVAAAQHERDARAREGLLANPVSFLRSRGWIGLLNVADAVPYVVPPSLSTDSLPLEDNQIQTEPPNSLSGSDWRERSPASSGKTKIVADIDLVARERANRSHYLLEKLLAGIVASKGYRRANRSSIGRKA